MDPYDGRILTISMRLMFVPQNGEACDSSASVSFLLFQLFFLELYNGLGTFLIIVDDDIGFSGVTFRIVM